MTKLIPLTLLMLCLGGCCPSPAQSAYSEIVLQTIAMESANQSAYGQFLVASVIVNRSQLYQKRGISTYKSLELVVLKPKQFSCWNSQKWAFSWLSRHYTPSAKDRASKALLLALNAPKKGITHYHTTSIMPYWAKGHRPVIVEGGHLFYGGRTWQK